MNVMGQQLICPRAIFFFIVAIGLSKNQPLNSTSDLLQKCVNCDTDVKPHELMILWTINRYDLHAKAGHTIVSPEFSSVTNDAVKWHFEITPNAEFDKNGSFRLWQYPKFVNSNNGIQLIADDQTKFLDGQQKTLWEDTTIGARYGVGGRGWYSIPTKTVLHSNNKLTIFCNLTFYEVFHNVSHQPNVTSPQLGVSKHQFRENLTSLFNNSEWADVVLSVNGKEYPAHKAILAARSPYFAAKFKRYLEKGKSIRQIHIEDSNEQVIGETLRYMYTGECKNLPTLAQDVLAAACKYGLDGLKTICAETLSNDLTVESAADTLMLADKHGVDDLKSKTIAFIAKKYAEVANTTSWKSIVRKNPEFAHEVCQVLSRNN